MGSSNICDKNGQSFCDFCAKRGITSNLVQFHVNLKEAILLCTDRCCLYPFGSGDISSFIVEKRSKEAAFSEYVEPNFARTVSVPGKLARGTRDNKPRKTKHDFSTTRSATEEQRQRSSGHVKGDFSDSKIHVPSGIEKLKVESYPEPKKDKKCVLRHSVQKDEGFVSARRLRKTVFEPYTPRRKNLCNHLPLKDIAYNNECTQLPVDLEKHYKELTKDEENFVIDIVLNSP